MNLAYAGETLSVIFDWDYVLWEVRLKLVAVGFFIYLGVFILLHWLASWISASYRTLSAKQKVFSNIAIARGLLGIQSCAAGLWAMLIDPVFQADKVYSQQKWSWFHCLIGSGFILFENVVVHVSNIVFRTCDVFLVVHHLFALGGLLGLIFNIKSGHYLPVMGLLLEMSTPSICMYSLLLRTGYANTLLWKANQWVLIHMQHCRMVLIYHMWWVCISNWNDVVENLGLPHFIVFFMGLSTLTIILNPYWIYRSTRRLFGPVDWNFSFFTAVFGSSGKLNSETLQKKRI
ncbi:protein CLN8-like [Gopherus evgoodei]|uniref:Protein CLN8-like n=1 Tax=Gopherus evgoodei TaxID=1825980 RepID=A0A8C4VCL0_9SAUR|nr:protein CLN8-like [Gopherus evgoodei]XP_030411414.1 protein CLN8-like [Gopherus evgoodei]XP_030411415.1 protein CLN8-like [Gopherus evgoodei]